MRDNNKPMIRLTPLTRIRMTVDREMEIDKSAEFNEDLYYKYIDRYNEAELKQQSIIKSVVIIDTILALLLFGQEIKFPWFGVSISDVPVIAEAMTVSSTLAFLFLILAFLNGQAYAGIIDQFHIKKSVVRAIDPEIIAAANRYTEFAFKTFRKKFNIWANDFFEPKCGFMVISYLVIISIIIALSSFLFLHIVVIYISLSTTISSYGLSGAVIVYSIFVVTISVSSILILLSMFKSFEFVITGVDENDGEAPSGEGAHSI